MGFQKTRYDQLMSTKLLHYFVVGGRPDVMKLIKEAYHSWGAEVVFITSNLQGNREMMEGCKLEGIPAFVRFVLMFDGEFF